MKPTRLTTKQEQLLRTAAEGIRNGSVDTSWSYTPEIGDEGIVDLLGFPEAKQLDLKLSDLYALEAAGYIARVRQDLYTTYYIVYEQVVLDFDGNEPPASKPTATDMPSQNITFGDVSGSNINIGNSLSNIRQSSQESPTNERILQEHIRRLHRTRDLVIQFYKAGLERKYQEKQLIEAELSYLAILVDNPTQLKAHINHLSEILNQPDASGETDGPAYATLHKVLKRIDQLIEERNRGA